MATDATGTPTSPDNIPTFNTAVDDPSGKGSNAQMAAIQTALLARPNTPSGISTNEAMVWNGTAWARSSVTGLAPSGLLGYPNNASKVLAGNGTWVGGMSLLWDSVDQGVSLPAASITISGIPQTFAHLKLIIDARSDQATTAENLDIRFNGTATGYDYAFLQASNSVVTAGAGTAQTQGLIGTIPGTTNTTSRSAIEVDIPQYTIATTTVQAYKFASFSVGSFTAATMVYIAGGGSYGSTGAVTSIIILPSAGNLIAPTRISLYGLGG